MILIIISLSCSEREPDIFYRKLDFKQNTLEYFQKNDTLATPPPQIISIYEIILPIVSDDQKFDIVVDNFLGKLVYDKYYSNDFISYASFLENLSEEELFIPAKYIDELNYTMKIDSNFYGFVNPDDDILKEYAEKGFSQILEKYFVKLGQDKKFFRYRLELGDSTYTYNSLYKVMYENKFIGGTDCVSGETKFFKFLE